MLTKRFFKYFIIGFITYLGLLLFEFFYHYSYDIFNKGVDNVYIIKLILYATNTLIGYALLCGVLVASIFTFRYISSKTSFGFKKPFLRSIIIALGSALGFLAFNNWILPRANIEMYPRLYDIRQHKSGFEVERSEKNSFLEFPTAMTISAINQHIDTLNEHHAFYVNNADSMLSQLPDTLSLKLCNDLQLWRYGIELSYSDADTLSHWNAKIISSNIYYANANLYEINKLHTRFRKEKNKRILSPLAFILLYLFGAAFGFYLGDKKIILFLIIGVLLLFMSNYLFRLTIGMSYFADIIKNVIILVELLFIITVLLIKALNSQSNFNSKS